MNYSDSAIEKKPVVEPNMGQHLALQLVQAGWFYVTNVNKRNQYQKMRGNTCGCTIYLHHCTTTLQYNNNIIFYKQ